MARRPYFLAELFPFVALRSHGPAEQQYTPANCDQTRQTVIHGLIEVDGLQAFSQAIWLFGDKTLPSAETNSPAVRVSSQAFPDGGVYLLGSSGPFPAQMVIDAGPQGTGHCGHGHGDADR